MSDRIQAVEPGGLEPSTHASIDMSTEDPPNGGETNRSQSHHQKNEKNEPAPRFLGIPGYHSQFSANRLYNYEEKYAPEPLGDELKENARVWKVYLDEAENYDDEMLHGFRDTLDSLLVFAALFSAVVTSFVISTVSALQPDYNQITATLLLEQVQLLRAAGNVTAINEIASFNVTQSTLSSGSPGANDLWINGLFFASLSLSLATALLSVLIKQWLQAYSSISSGNARERSFIRHFRFEGIEKWKVPEIIGVLPLILHTSLALFFVGLSLYVGELHKSLTWVVVTVTVLAFSIYLGSVFLPAIWLQCPYRIPLLFVPAKNILHFLTSLNWVSKPSFHSLKSSELELFKLQPETYHTSVAGILAWLCTLESNLSIQRIVAQSIHGILKNIEYNHWPWYNAKLQKHRNSLFQTMWNSLVEINGDDIYGLQIWPSVISEWIKKRSWELWRLPVDTEIIRKCFLQAIEENRKVAVAEILKISKLEQAEYSPFKQKIREWSTVGLQKYSEAGNIDAVKSLVEFGDANVNAQGGEYGTALQAATWGRRLEIVKYLVDKGADVNAQGGKYGSVLQIAVRGHQLEIVKYLVDKGADVNAQGGNYGSVLQIAVRGHQLEIVKHLVDKGADINAQGGTALQTAAVRYWNNWTMVKYLVDKGADVNAQGGEYGTVLHGVALLGTLEMVKYLVDKGADVNTQGKYGTVLQGAALEGRLKIVKYLVDKGADVNTKRGEYGTALQAAALQRLDVNAQEGEYETTQIQATALKGEWEIVNYWVDRGADVDAQGGMYGTALQAARLQEKLEIVKYLVDKDADVNAQGGEYGTALQGAALEGRLEIVKYLVDKGANINAQGGKYGTALQAAASEWYLVDKGADIDVHGGEYRTAIHAAEFECRLEIVKYLVDNGADVNVQGLGEYGTALQAAASWRSRAPLEIVKYLVDKGADINAQGEKYGTALQAAASKCRLEIVKYLVDNGADVNAQGGKYGTALQAAASQGEEYGTTLQAAAYQESLEIVMYLVDKGADVNAQGGKYGTALQAAAVTSWNDLAMVKYLVDKGADVGVTGGMHWSPFKAAVWSNNTGVIQFLQDHGARE